MVDAAAIAIADTDTIVIAAALKRLPLELLRGVRDEHPRPTEHRPRMIEIAGRKPCLLRTHCLGQAKRDRQDRRFFQSEAGAENGSGRDIGDDRQIATADKHSAAVDNLHEIDVGWRVIDLADIERAVVMLSPFYPRDNA